MRMGTEGEAARDARQTCVPYPFPPSPLPPSLVEALTLLGLGLQVGQVDRGASLSWVSQYPMEEVRRCCGSAAQLEGRAAVQGLSTRLRMGGQCRWVNERGSGRWLNGRWRGLG